MPRLFVAFPLPPSVQDALNNLRRQLAARLPGPGIKWASPHQYHLTLKFLGDVDQETVPELSAAVEKAGASCSPLQLSTAGLGVFPHPRRPKVIWVGIGGDLDDLARLQARIETALEPWCPREERPFHPHVTLARIKAPHRSLSRALSAFLEKGAPIESQPWSCDAVELIQSDLNPEGSRYTTLLRAELTG